MSEVLSLDALRARVRVLEAGETERRTALPLGAPALDARLPGGGLPLAGLHEVAGERAEWDDGVALGFLLALLSRVLTGAARTAALGIGQARPSCARSARGRRRSRAPDPAACRRRGRSALGFGGGALGQGLRRRGRRDRQPGSYRRAAPAACRRGRRTALLRAASAAHGVTPARRSQRRLDPLAGRPSALGYVLDRGDPGGAARQSGAAAEATGRGFLPPCGGGSRRGASAAAD